VDTAVLRRNTCINCSKCKDFRQQWHKPVKCFSQALNNVTNLGGGGGRGGGFGESAWSLDRYRRYCLTTFRQFRLVCAEIITPKSVTASAGNSSQFVEHHHA
jgi:hypothetical protein